MAGSGHVAARFWVLTNKINVEDVLKVDSCSYLAWCRGENIMFSSKQTHMLDYFICYHPESWCHVTRPNPRSFSRERKEPGNEVGSADASSFHFIAHIVFCYLFLCYLNCYACACAGLKGIRMK